MPGAEFLLDAGALIAYERDDRRVRSLVRLARSGEVALRTSSAVIAQVWRDGARQAALAQLLRTDLVAEDGLLPADARLVGTLCARTGTSDVVDAHLAVLAERRTAAVVTSDPSGMARLGLPGARIVRC